MVFISLPVKFYRFWPFPPELASTCMRAKGINFPQVESRGELFLRVAEMSIEIRNMANSKIESTTEKIPKLILQNIEKHVDCEQCLLVPLSDRARRTSGARVCSAYLARLSERKDTARG